MCPNLLYFECLSSTEPTFSSLHSHGVESHPRPHKDFGWVTWWADAISQSVASLQGYGRQIAKIQWGGNYVIFHQLNDLISNLQRTPYDEDKQT